jgi:hypothetical protein
VPNRHLVQATPRAQQQINALRGTVSKRFKQVVEEIAQQGCQAFGYRLTGPVAEHLCDRHLVGRWRLIAAFAPDDVIWVLVVGEHLDARPEVDVYRALYDLIGVAPEPTEKRTKPPCCDPDTGLPPGVDEILVDDLVARSRALTRRR